MAHSYTRIKEITAALLYPTLLGVALVVLVAVVARTPPQSITYTNAAAYLPSGTAVYLPEKPRYAQGETLLVTATLELHQVGITDARRGWRTYPAGVWARLCDGTNAPIIARTPPPFVDENLAGPTLLPIREKIPHMPPGTYQLTSTSFNSEGGQTTFRVPFVLTGNC